MADREGVDVHDGISAPAICDRCGTVFPSGFAFGPGTSGITMVGNKSGPCPRCGGMGSVPDGVYAVVDELLVLRQIRPVVTDELAALRAEVERLGSEVSRERLERVVVDTAPTAAPLILRLLRDPALGGALALVSVVLAVITVVLG